MSNAVPLGPRPPEGPALPPIQVTGNVMRTPAGPAGLVTFAIGPAQFTFMASETACQELATNVPQLLRNLANMIRNERLGLVIPEPKLPPNLLGPNGNGHGRP